jgi:hypothetical protein
MPNIPTANKQKASIVAQAAKKPLEVVPNNICPIEDNHTVFVVMLLIRMVNSPITPIFVKSDALIVKSSISCVGYIVLSQNSL